MTKHHLSRRGVAGTFFFGYAVAALGAEAAPITTASDGLWTKDLTIAPEKDEGAYQIPAFIAMPAKPGHHKVVLVVSEIFGLHDYIRDVCRRLAAQGYVALALDYFARKGILAGMSDFKQIMPIVQATPYTQVMSDLKAALKFLKTLPDLGQPVGAKPDMNHVGVTGFCWGGAVVWMAAATLPEITAGVAWYGRLEAPAPNPNGPQPEVRQWPIDIAASLSKPVLGLYGEKDTGISLDSVGRMNAALAASGKTPSHIKVFPGAPHGFHADYRPSYTEAAAKEGWADLSDWFARYL